MWDNRPIGLGNRNFKDPKTQKKEAIDPGV